MEGRGKGQQIVISLSFSPESWMMNLALDRPTHIHSSIFLFGPEDRR